MDRPVASATTRPVQDLEQRYRERAAEWLAEAPTAVLLGSTPPPGEAGPLLGGWWCAPDTDGVLVLPNPWDDRDAIAVYEEHCWQLTRSLLDRLRVLLDEAHGVERPAEYWNLLVEPWLLITVTELVDRRLFCATARELAPDAPFLAGRRCVAPPSIEEAIDAQLAEPWNTWAIGLMAEALGIPTRDLASPVAPPARPPAPPPWQVRLLRAAHGLLAFRRGRRIALLGQMNLTSKELLRLGRRVRGLRLAAPPRPLPPGAAAHTRDLLRRRLRDGDEIERLLPELMPQSLLEGYEQLAAESLRRFGPPCAVVHGNYGHVDAENEFVGRCRAAGFTIGFAQHGGTTLQLETVSGGDRHEQREGAVRITWGGSGPGVRAIPNPHPARVRDRYLGGERVVVVESLNPPYRYVFRLSSAPLGNQALRDEERLDAFVASVGSARPHLTLKAFPGSEGVRRPPAVAALPLAGGHPAAWWMQRSRLAVVTYPDTPFIQAMAIGVPVIGLWDTSLWSMRADAAPHFDELRRLGVIHSDPASAAAKVDEVYDAAGDWWAGAEIQAARRAFLDRFALSGDWLREWAAVLNEIAEGRC